MVIISRQVNCFAFTSWYLDADGCFIFVFIFVILCAIVTSEVINAKCKHVFV